MGILKFSIFVDGILGSVGGTTFGYGHSGPTVRRRQKPTFPRTNRQGERNAQIAVFSQAWRDTATPTNRTDWATLAAATTFINQFDNPYTVQPNALFTRSQSALQIAGQTLALSPPMAATEVAPDWTLDSAIIGQVRVATWPNFTPVGFGFALFFVSKPQSQARVNNPTSFEFVAAVMISAFVILPQIIFTLPASESGTFRFVRGIVVRTEPALGIPVSDMKGKVSFEHFAKILVA